jgi:farnesyl-diphosphate farnesyltransferase
VGEFWVKIFDLPVELTELAVAYGKGLQRINIYRDAPEDLARGRVYFSRELLSATGVESDLLWKSKKWSEFSSVYLDQTEKFLREGILFGDKLSNADRRLRWASFIPCAIGLSTLQKLRLMSLKDARIKISRSDVRTLAAKAAWKVLFRLPFSSCASQ